MKKLTKTIKSVTVVRKFSLYIDGKAVPVPKNPTWLGDLINYRSGMTVSLGKTVPGKELTWFDTLFDDGSETWFCDRNLMNWVSFEQLRELGLVDTIWSGSDFAARWGTKPHLSLPRMGRTSDEKYDSSEWALIMKFLNTELLHWRECYSWGEDTFEEDDTMMAPLRGYEYADAWVAYETGEHFSSGGWRPVLRFPVAKL